MNDENTTRIITACPSLFSTMNEQVDAMEQGRYFTPIAFGFECGDGWAEILVELCEKIQARLKDLPKEVAEDLVALQVKEKYGTLRFYLSSHDDVIESFIKEAEEKSAHTCETCGKTGKLRGKFWYYAACDEHTLENDKKIWTQNSPLDDQ